MGCLICSVDQIESQLFFKRSTNNGASFGSVKKIDNIVEDIQTQE